MTSTRTKSIVFLALTFAVSWGIAISGYYSGIAQRLGPQGAVAILAAMMAGPAIAALICTIVFEKGRRLDALGFRGKWSIWWLLAWAIPVAVSFASLGITLLLTDQHYVDMGQATRQMLEAQGQDVSQVPAWTLSTAFLIGIAVIVGPLINWLVLTVTEELGWRGYLYHLWSPSGFWRTAIFTGLIWGFWHAPAIYLYGHNFPTEPVLGVVIFTFYCVPLAVLHTHVRERCNSVWAAGLMHGTFNAAPGISIASLSAPEFPWTGIIGIGGMIALVIAAAIIAVLRMGQKPAPVAAPA